MLRTIQRKVAQARAGQGMLRAGVGLAGTTPHFDLPMAGYSMSGQFSRGVQGRLWARAFYLEDAGGSRAAICVIDGHSASRWLLERAAAQTAAAGIDASCLILAGTHSHTAPGQFYGCSLYDTLAAPEVGFDEELANWWASRIAVAVKAAVKSARPAKIGFATETVWGLSRNRSLPAFERNAEASRWARKGMPGHSPPKGLSSSQRAVDPRLRVMSFVDAKSKKIFGVFASFACHATALGPSASVFSADWPGYACQEAARRFKGASDPLVAVALSGAGDMTPMPSDGSQGHEVAGRVGSAIARALETAGRLAAATAKGELPIDIRYAESALADREVEGYARTELSTRPYLGVATMAGSEESRTFFYTSGTAREPAPGRYFSSADPQYPKEMALGVLQELFVGAAKALTTSPVLPVHALRIGEHAFITVPGEPTVTTALRLEKTATAIDGIESAQVIGYAGDYLGYFTTPEEYEAQHYEGSSTIYGRNSTQHLMARLDCLLRGNVPPSLSGGSIHFEVAAPKRRYRGASRRSTVKTDSFWAKRDDRQIEVHWDSGPHDRLVLGEHDRYFACLGVWKKGRFENLLFGGLRFTDLFFPMKLTASPPDLLNPTQHWILTLWLPEGMKILPNLCVNLAKVGSFKGCTVPIP